MGFMDLFIKQDLFVKNKQTGKVENWKGKTLFNVKTKGNLPFNCYDVKNHITDSGYEVTHSISNWSFEKR